MGLPPDVAPPEITDVVMTASDLLETGPGFGWEKVTCTITDNRAVLTAKLVVTNPDHITIVEYTMTNIDPVADTYECNITLTLPGNYSYHVWASDFKPNTNTSDPELLFALPPNWDVDMNGRTYSNDLMSIIWIYGISGPGYPSSSSFGWIREDIDNNGRVYSNDLMNVIWHYGEYWWT